MQKRNENTYRIEREFCTEQTAEQLLLQIFRALTQDDYEEENQ